MEKTNIITNTIKIFLHLSCIISIALSGLFVCINNSYVTQILSDTTNTYLYTNYTKTQVTNAAVLTRDFSLSYITYAELSDKLSSIGVNAEDLNKDMIEHLAECTPIFKTITYTEVACIITTIILTIIYTRLKGSNAVFKLLKYDSILTIFIFTTLGILMVISFDVLFANMHKLFFVDGTWTFAYDSLLICMYPQNFWIGMGAVWCLISLIVSIILIIISKQVLKYHKI